MVKTIILFIFSLPLVIQAISSYIRRKTVSFKDVWIGVIIAVLGALFVLVLDEIVKFIVDVLWFSEVGYFNVFWGIIQYKIWIFVITFVIVLTGFILFVYIPIKIFFPRFPIGLIKVVEFEMMKVVERFSNVIVWLFLVVVSGYFGYIAATNDWMDIAKFFSRVSTLEYTDPIFKMPAEFYMFSLPFINAVFNNILWFLFIVSAFMIFILYVYLRFQSGYYGQSFVFALLSGRMPDKISRGIFLYSIFVLIVWTLVLGIRIAFVTPYHIMFVDSGLFSGPGYKEIYATLPVIRIIGILLILLAILSTFFLFSGKIRNILILSGGTVGISLALYVIYPSLIEVFVVKPSELDRQKEFIKNNIESTLVAYKLDKVKEVFFDNKPLTFDMLSRNKEIIQNLRLWDWKPLGDAYKQIQTIRFYYKFNDIDIDRYRLGGSLRQVMISARELDIEALPENSKSWINVHFRYTHGIGVVVSPVNEILPNGMPKLFVKDIPPISSYPEVSVEEPRIYFGELTDHYVFVNAGIDEFDYPSSAGEGEENVYTRYKGTAGIKIDNFWKKLLFAVYLNEEIKMLFSEYINDETRILINRNVLKRIDKIIPFILYEDDPYIVVSKGKLYWIIDGYTVSDQFPYSTYSGGINYIRNAVKVVVDAYNGNVEYYIVDKNEPVINVFKNMFNIQFKELEQMDEDLRQHIRYPERLLRVQSRIFRLYHMKDPEIFFNQEDVWNIAKEVKFGNNIEVEPYYIVTKLPDKKELNFILVLPFTPKDKDNLIAWMAVKSDYENYGEIIVYRMPKDRLVFGPLQIEARISQDPEISAQITLWNQQGSQVLRGNMMILPIENSLLYYEPIYLQAEEAKIPEFRRVAMSDGERIVWDETVPQTISKLFTGQKIEITEVEKVASQVPEKTTGISKTVLLRALQYIEEYKKLTGNGDFVGGARKLKELEEFLRENTK
ncbi:MAG: UPF0182 family protein [Spirochaetia bacterium]|nr:UPF0182 family protein [Spirochaetota bacterium]MDW8111886.1 UPF0182 family protein [Spirochaetia bacterium]